MPGLCSEEELQSDTRASRLEVELSIQELGARCWTHTTAMELRTRAAAYLSSFRAWSAKCSAVTAACCGSAFSETRLPVVFVTSLAYIESREEKSIQKKPLPQVAAQVVGEH